MLRISPDPQSPLISSLCRRLVALPAVVGPAVTGLPVRKDAVARLAAVGICDDLVGVVLPDAEGRRGVRYPGARRGCSGGRRGRCRALPAEVRPLLADGSSGEDADPVLAAIGAVRPNFVPGVRLLGAVRCRRVGDARGRGDRRGSCPAGRCRGAARDDKHQPEADDDKDEVEHFHRNTSPDLCSPPQ